MSSSKNYIRDQIFTCIEISKRSKVPFLFFSNPGYGKTTSINLYAKQNGYHVETLIGSHYSQDEILGFQANADGKHLAILKPEWYSRIMYAHSKNIPSILFLDELSTVSPNVQGALLQLCFERKIRGDNALPEDCIVIAAANYKQNLPGYSDIIAPEINRFCIINLLPDSNNSNFDNAMQLLEEFTQDFKEVSDNLPVFSTNFHFTEADNRRFLENARSGFASIFENHRHEKASSVSAINFRNTIYDGIYDTTNGITEVYNFISPRTISYYLRIVRVLCEMGVQRDNVVVKKIISGLMGLGTNTFLQDDEAATVAQINFFQNELYDMTSLLLRDFSPLHINHNSENTSDNKRPGDVNPESQKIFQGNTIGSKIRNYITAHDTKAVRLDKELTELGKLIGFSFNTLNVEQSKQRLFLDKSRFRSDYEAVRILYEFLSHRLADNDEAGIFLKGINSTIQSFTGVYDESFAA